jgi:P4 family phage/plasmid primase-like protien
MERPSLTTRVFPTILPTAWAGLRYTGFEEPTSSITQTEMYRNTSPAVGKTERRSIVNASINTEHFTDMGNGERFCRLQGRDVRFCLETQSWYVFTGEKWEEDAGSTIVKNKAKEVVRTMYREAADIINDRERKELANHALHSESAQATRAMIELAKSEKQLWIRSEKFDSDATDWLFNCSNGTVNLKTGDLLPHRQEDFITRCAKAAYHPGASCELWKKTVREILGGDDELYEFMHRFLGYTLTGVTGEQCFLLCHGNGNNGKSTLLETIAKVLGDYAQMATFDTFLAKDKSGIPNDIARMVGKRLVVAKETDEGKRLSEALIKSLTGGDTISARFLHKEYFDFKPKAKIILAANHMPEIRGTDRGMWRRIRRVPFNVSFELDATLPERLLEESEGILAWLIEGCLLWLRDGLRNAQAISDATEQYREDMETPFDGFVRDKCILGAGNTKAQELYDAYQIWCEKFTEEYNKADVKRGLDNRGIKRSRNKHGYVYHGIEVKVENAPDGNEPKETPEDFTRGIDVACLHVKSGVPGVPGEPENGNFSRREKYSKNSQKVVHPGSPVHPSLKNGNQIKDTTQVVNEPEMSEYQKAERKNMLNLLNGEV